MALIHFDKERFELALASGKPMLMDFWADWCLPCRMVGPAIEKLARDYEGKDVLIGKLDVDKLPTIADRYNVTGIPTVILFQDGQEVERKVGVMPKLVYARALDKLLKRGSEA